jgi:membrane-associated protease RseP (regulator of RpoE activity)
MFKFERFGFEIHPLYVMYKSKRLNSLLIRLGKWNPSFWQVFGNIGIVSFFGQVSFMAYLLIRNLYKFVFVPQQASPVMPLIPGVTIRFSSLPWFLVAAGVVILLHELMHGIQCAVEGIPVKNAALLVAVLTFGGAVEPDEEAMQASKLISRLRVFASGSLINLITGLVVIMIIFIFQGGLPSWVAIFLNWLYFLSINLALVNMLPVYPMDGGQMARAWLEIHEGWGRAMEKVTKYCFLALIVSNLIFSLIQFGLIPL